MSVFDIAFTGTSLTTGPASRGWQQEVISRLQPASRYSQIINYDLGAPGQSSAWGLANIQNVIDMRPRVAVIEFGMNDGVPSSGISVDQFILNCRAMVQALKTNSPETRIILMTMNPNIPPGTATNVAQYYAALRLLALEQGVLLIDNTPSWAGMTTAEAPDGVHPLQAPVFAKMVPNVVAALRPLVSV